MITDWLMVIITAVYVVATIFICKANFSSANETKKQTEEMQLEFYSRERPKVSVEIVYLRKAFWALRFTNYGSLTAFNLKIELAEDFIESLPEQNMKNLLRDEKGKVLTLGINQHYDLFFGTNIYRKTPNKRPIIGRLYYNGWNNSVFAEDFKIETENYATFFSVDTDMDDIKKRLDEQNKLLKRIVVALENNHLGDQANGGEQNA